MRSAVILTRPSGENTELADRLRSRGHEVVELPCIAASPLEDDSALAAAIGALGASDRLIITSRAGAQAVISAVREIAAPVATVGLRAAAALRAAGVTVDRIAASGRDLAVAIEIPAGVVLLARSDRALRDLPTLLAARGARVREVVAYRTVASAEGDAERASALLASGAAVVIASPSAFDALVDRLGAGAISSARLIATGPSTAARVQERTGRPATVAAWDRIPEVL